MDSLTLFGHLFKTRCEAICIFLDFFTEKRGLQREIYDFFRKSHETHCICKRFSIYCNKNCSGNMRILCPFAEITYTPSGDENFYLRSITYPSFLKQLTPRQGTKTLRHIFHMTNRARNNLHPARGRKHKCDYASDGTVQKQLTPRQGTKTSNQ